MQGFASAQVANGLGRSQRQPANARCRCSYAMQPAEPPATVDDAPVNAMHVLCERLRPMDKITIAQVEGRAAGG